MLGMGLLQMSNILPNISEVGVHVTPTVSIDGIVDDSVSSGSSEDDLVKLFESKL